jgi:hypothetical protein
MSTSVITVFPVHHNISQIYQLNKHSDVSQYYYDLNAYCQSCTSEGLVVPSHFLRQEIFRSGILCGTI